MTLLLIFIVIMGCLYFYLTNSINSVMSKERQLIIFNKIKESEELPNSFYIQYEKLNPNGLKRSYTESLLSRLSNNFKKCACEEIYAHPGYFDNYNRFAPHIFVYEANKKVGAKKCLDYELQNADFTNGINGVKLASRKYFNKEINDLNDIEVLDLLIIHENPRLYNPLKRREKLIKRREYILAK
jgi:hypothetical protein